MKAQSITVYDFFEILKSAKTMGKKKRIYEGIG